MRAQLIRAAELRAVPWKNGGGVTRELACEPPGAGYDTFLWRISVADVERPGPFSRFPGIDRSIVLLHGGPMLLGGGNGGAHELRAWEPWHFAGEDAVDAQLPAGPTRDFNVMRRRAAIVSRTAVRQASQMLVLGSGTVILFCGTGACSVTPLDADWPAAAGLPAARGRLGLGEGDTLRLDLAAGAALTLAVDMPESTARLIDVRLEATGPCTDSAIDTPATTDTPAAVDASSSNIDSPDTINISASTDSVARARTGNGDGDGDGIDSGIHIKADAETNTRADTDIGANTEAAT